MKTLFYTMLCAALLSSCSMAALDRYPGAKQDSIPAAFRGSYYLKLKPHSKDPNDSMWVGIHATGWSYTEGSKRVDYKLSDDHVLSKVGKYYVLSTHDEAFREYWNSWVLLPRKKDLELYPVVTIRHPHSDRLAAFLKVRYAGMRQQDSAFVYEMNDEAFVKYFEKAIKGGKTFSIIRINPSKP